MTNEEKIQKDPLKRQRGADLKTLKLFHDPEELK